MKHLMLIGALAGLCLAQDKSAAPDELLLSNGTKIHGKILDVSHAGVKIQTKDRTTTIKLRKLDARHFFGLMDGKIDKKDAESRLKLAVYAYENGLFTQARSVYRHVLLLNPELVKKFEAEILPKIKSEIAKNLMFRAKQAAEKKDWTFAERALGEILTEMSETPVADEARKLIAHYSMMQLDEDDLAREKKAAEAAKRAKRDAAKLEAARERVVGPIENLINHGQKMQLRGLRTKNSSQARSTLNASAKKFESALKRIAREEKKLENAPDEVLSKHLEELKKVATREAVESHLHVGSHLLIRRDYKGALRAADMAIALDSKSEYAWQFKARVETEAQVRQGWRR